MEEIPAEHTKISKEEGARVIDAIKRMLAKHAFSLKYEFEMQGSVMSNTHIRGYSDVDVLTLASDEVDKGDPAPNFAALVDGQEGLHAMRAITYICLTEAFPAANVEDKDKSITLKGGSLRRDVDVVAATWWDTFDYIQTKDKAVRGVCVFSRATDTRIPNKPFLHAQRIIQRDASSRGHLRRLIRLLKTIKADANEEKPDTVTISSYDIAAIAYGFFSTPSGQTVSIYPATVPAVQLATLLLEYMRRLEGIQVLRDALMVPNGMRKVFVSGGATVEDLSVLRALLEGLVVAASASTLRYGPACGVAITPR
jgi:hypothetical protein